MSSCIFCEIVDKQSPASIFYEDDTVLGLMTIGPVTTGHAMIIPKKHAAYLKDMDEDTGRHLWTVTHRTAEAIRQSGVRCEGINIFLADGEAAFQEVFHLHMHVFPRYVGDPFKIEANWDIKPPRKKLNDVAKMIQVAYDKLWSPNHYTLHLTDPHR